MAPGTRRPLTRVAAFWDSSLLIPLCVRQPATARATALYPNYDTVVWWGTPVEIASALARLARMGQVDAATLNRARRLARDLADSWMVVEPADAVRDLAIELVHRYQLRAADALQLAAALAWCANRPQGRVFLTDDEKLRDAALRAGFDTHH
jgi:predicted nucleic acid-binding protein